jgi:hypothetical protein
VLCACLQYCGERRYVTTVINSTNVANLLAMKAINAETKENRHEYDFKPRNASNPDAS